MPVVAEREPRRICVSWRVMAKAVGGEGGDAAMINLPMEMREPCYARVGEMWALQACGGSIGIFRRTVWVDVIVLPLGSKTDMLGWLVVC